VDVALRKGNKKRGGEGPEGRGRRVDVDSLMKSGCQTASLSVAAAFNLNGPRPLA